VIDKAGNQDSGLFRALLASYLCPLTNVGRVVSELVKYDNLERQQQMPTLTQRGRGDSFNLAKFFVSKVQDVFLSHT
jgi:hypothetical protein